MDTEAEKEGKWEINEKEQRKEIVLFEYQKWSKPEGAFCS